MLYSTYITVAAFAYMAFVFFSESFNPFYAAKGHSRRRWRLARSLTLLFFLISTVALHIDANYGLSKQQMILGAAALFFILSLFPIHKYHKANGHPSNGAPKELSIVATPTIASSTETKDKQIPSTTDYPAMIDTLGLEAQQQSINFSISDIQKLETELSITSPDEEFDDLDQTETEFSFADLTISESLDVAKSDLSSSFNNSMINDALMEKLGEQDKTILDLTKSNQSLLDELTDLKYALKRSKKITRKSIMQRDKAVEIKNSALALATMEREKRKLTEIETHKKVLKTKNSLKQLSEHTIEEAS